MRGLRHDLAIRQYHGVRQMAGTQIGRDVTDVARHAHQAIGGPVRRREQRHRQADLPRDDPYRLDEVGIVGEDCCLVERTREGITDEMGCEVDVGALLLGFPDIEQIPLAWNRYL